MLVTNITDDYNNITSSNCTDMLNDYDNITSTNLSISNCKNNENNIHKIIPSSLLTIPCGLSFFCQMGFMVYTLIKTLFNNKELEKFL